MPRYNNNANFYEFPDVPNGYPLPPSFSIIVPCDEDRTNLIENPSFEIDSGNWSPNSGASIGVSTDYQFVGAKSAIINISQSDGGVYYGGTSTLDFTSGEVYGTSFRILSLVGNMPLTAYIATSAGVRISGINFRTTGFWQRITFLYKETSTTNRRLYITANGPELINKNIYLDAVQVELTSDSKRYCTVYIDGDQKGTTRNEFPQPYYWHGTRQYSKSTRSRYTRSGGQIINLRDLGLSISATNGLALAVPQVVSMPFGQLDGEQYERTRKEPRQFSIAGRVTGRSATQLDSQFGALTEVFDRDYHSRDDIIYLIYTPLNEEEVQIGPEILIPCSYIGGLEGQRNNLSSEIFTASFMKQSPDFTSHSQGAVLGDGQSVANTVGIVKRSSNGTWSALSTGLSGGSAAATSVAIHPDGTIYVGGDFTDAGGSGAQYAAKYNPSTNTFSVIKGATSFNSIVYSIVIDQNGYVYFGGQFTNVDGIAAADGIVQYNPTANTFSALGTGVSVAGSDYVTDMDFDSSGNLYAVGTFATMGGVANTAGVAKWNGSAWSALGTGANNDVSCVLCVGTNVYIGGIFTLAGGVANTVRIARWNGSTWNAMGTGANAGVYDLDVGLDGYIYIAGDFTTLNGSDIRYFGKWNGVSFDVVGSANALNTTARSCKVAPDGTIYIAGDFTAVNGITLPDRMVRWDGSSFLPLDVNLPSSGVSISAISPGGDLYIGFVPSGGTSSDAASVTTIINNGNTRSYPTIVVTNGSSSSRLYQIANLTTNRYIYFNYTLVPSEVAVFDFTPTGISLRSNFQGDVSRNVQPGSYESDFYLAKGSNNMSVLTSTLDMEILMYWNMCFSSLSNAVGKI